MEPYHGRWDVEVQVIEAQAPLRMVVQNVDVPVQVLQGADEIRDSYVGTLICMCVQHELNSMLIIQLLLELLTQHF
jgi:hypothetical protein